MQVGASLWLVHLWRAPTAGDDGASTEPAADVALGREEDRSREEDQEEGGQVMDCCRDTVCPKACEWMHHNVWLLLAVVGLLLVGHWIFSGKY